MVPVLPPSAANQPTRPTTQITKSPRAGAARPATAALRLNGRPPRAGVRDEGDDGRDGRGGLSWSVIVASFTQPGAAPSLPRRVTVRCARALCRPCAPVGRVPPPSAGRRPRDGDRAPRRPAGPGRRRDRRRRRPGRRAPGRRLATRRRSPARPTASRTSSPTTGARSASATATPPRRPTCATSPTPWSPAAGSGRAGSAPTPATRTRSRCRRPTSRPTRCSPTSATATSSRTCSPTRCAVLAHRRRRWCAATSPA